MISNIGTVSRSDNRSTWWSITSFESSEIESLKNQTKWPPQLLEVLGGMEICPSTGAQHYQGALHYNRQVRFSAVKRFLPKAHIEACKNVEALKKYVMKPETACGEKQVIKSVNKFYRPCDILYLMAKKFVEAEMTLDDIYNDPDGCKYYRVLMRRVIKDDITVVNYVDGKLKQNWIDFYSVFINRVRADSLNSITGNLPAAE